MGTRGLTCVVKGKEFKVANYNQWDSYPSGQGVTALNFLSTKLNLALFNEKVSKVKVLSDEARQDMMVECGAKRGSEWITMDVSDNFKKNFPYLHRDCGAEILEFVQNLPEGLALTSQLSFAADSLFCEWAYLIDLDKNTFEVYQGFNKDSLTSDDRFYFLSEASKSKDDTSGSEQYQPVKLVKSYSLFELPDEETFNKECEPREEDEE